MLSPSSFSSSPPPSKPAHRLTSGIPTASALNKLLEVKFSDRPSPKTMTLSALYSLVAELEFEEQDGVNDNSNNPATAAAPTQSSSSFHGAFVEGSGVLRWAASNTHKYGGDKGDDDDDDEQKRDKRGDKRAGNTRKRREVWTFLSTASFAKQWKVPQEALEGTEAEAAVTKVLFGS
jgi:hypothetical protein